MMSPDLQLDQVDACLVALEDPVVGLDLAQAIEESCLGARVILVRSGAEALAALAPIRRMALAYLGLGPSALRRSRLPGAIAARGGRVVLIGEEAEQRGESEGWLVLHRPFTTASVHRQLESVLGLR